MDPEPSQEVTNVEVVTETTRVLLEELVHTSAGNNRNCSSFTKTHLMSDCLLKLLLITLNVTLCVFLPCVDTAG